VPLLPAACGPHVDPAHFRLMMARSESCRTAAHFMLIGVPHHQHICADACERIAG